MTGSPPAHPPVPASDPATVSTAAPSSITTSDPTAVTPASPLQRRGLITALIAMAAAGCILLVLLVLPAAGRDPYTRQTLQLTGSRDAGERLFRINCAGCHGIAGQGLVGPNLHGVRQRKTNAQLIRQVVSGRTPPMPRFQPEPQAMADLIAYLRSLT